VLLGPVFGREQEEDGEDRLLVERGEVDAGGGEADGGGEPLDRLVLDVGDGDALAEAGGPAAFAFEDAVDEFVAQRSVGRARADERVDQFADDGRGRCRSVARQWPRAARVC